MTDSACVTPDDDLKQRILEQIGAFRLMSRFHPEPPLDPEILIRNILLILGRDPDQPQQDEPGEDPTKTLEYSSLRHAFFTLSSLNPKLDPSILIQSMDEYFAMTESNKTGQEGKSEPGSNLKQGLSSRATAKTGEVRGEKRKLVQFEVDTEDEDALAEGTQPNWEEFGSGPSGHYGVQEQDQAQNDEELKEKEEEEEEEPELEVAQMEEDYPEDNPLFMTLQYMENSASWIVKSEDFPNIKSLRGLTKCLDDWNSNSKSSKNYDSSSNKFQPGHLQSTRFSFVGVNLESEDAASFLSKYGRSIRYFEWMGKKQSQFSHSRKRPRQALSGTIILYTLRKLLTSFCPNLIFLGLNGSLLHSQKYFEAGKLFPKRSSFSSTRLPELQVLRISFDVSKCETISGLLQDLLEVSPNLNSFQTFNDEAQPIYLPLLPAFLNTDKMALVTDLVFHPESERALETYESVANYSKSDQSYNDGQLFSLRTLRLDLDDIRELPSLWAKMASILLQLLTAHAPLLEQIWLKGSINWLSAKIFPGFPPLESVHTLHIRFKEGASVFPDRIGWDLPRVFPNLESVYLGVWWNSKFHHNEFRRSVSSGGKSPSEFLCNVERMETVKKLFVHKSASPIHLRWVDQLLNCVFPNVEEMELGISSEFADCELWRNLVKLKSLKLFLHCKEPLKDGQWDQFFTGGRISGEEPKKAGPRKKLYTGGEETKEAMKAEKSSIALLTNLEALELSFLGSFDSSSAGFPRILTAISGKFGFGLLNDVTTRISVEELQSDRKSEIYAALEALQPFAIVESPSPKD